MLVYIFGQQVKDHGITQFINTTLSEADALCVLREAGGLRDLR